MQAAPACLNSFSGQLLEELGRRKTENSQIDMTGDDRRRAKKTALVVTGHRIEQQAPRSDDQCVAFNECNVPEAAGRVVGGEPLLDVAEKTGHVVLALLFDERQFGVFRRLESGAILAMQRVALPPGMLDD